jgi:hypothetical protein
MKKILGNAKANVCVADSETRRVLFEDSNLFVDTGRVFVANIFSGITSLIASRFVCDLGNDATLPAIAQIDLLGYISPLSIPVNTPTYPTLLSGEPTGVHLQFIFNNTGYGGDKTVRELGLFYRDLPTFPLRGAVPATDFGIMLARLKTTYSSIVVGDTKSITIDWKIIF